MPDTTPKDVMDLLRRAGALIQKLDQHEGAEGWSAGMKDEIKSILHDIKRATHG